MPSTAATIPVRLFCIEGEVRNIFSKCQKSSDSSNFSITGVGLVKIDDIPDRGEILHETNQ